MDTRDRDNCSGGIKPHGEAKRLISPFTPNVRLSTLLFSVISTGCSCESYNVDQVAPQLPVFLRATDCCLDYKEQFILRTEKEVNRCKHIV